MDDYAPLAAPDQAPGLTALVRQRASRFRREMTIPVAPPPRSPGYPPHPLADHAGSGLPTVGSAPVVALLLREPLDDERPAAPGFEVLPWLVAEQCDLTRRERQVLTLLCMRLTDAEIAARLFLSPRTINSHVAHILAKLGVANRREAAALAIRLRLA